MKKILSALKKTGLYHTVSNVPNGTFMEKEVTIETKKANVIITDSIFTDGIEVSIERPRSSTPYTLKSFHSEVKAIGYLCNQGIL